MRINIELDFIEMRDLFLTNYGAMLSAKANGLNPAPYIKLHEHFLAEFKKALTGNEYEILLKELCQLSCDMRTPEGQEIMLSVVKKMCNVTPGEPGEPVNLKF